MGPATSQGLLAHVFEQAAPGDAAGCCDAIERFGEDVLNPAGQWLKADLNRSSGSQGESIPRVPRDRAEALVSLVGQACRAGTAHWLGDELKISRVHGQTDLGVSQIGQVAGRHKTTVLTKAMQACA